MNTRSTFADIAPSLALILLGLLSPAQRLPAQAFTPTRFTVEDAGVPGKPDVILILGLSSSRSVWHAEAKRLAPNYSLHLLQLDGFAGQPAGPNATGPLLPAMVDELHSYIATRNMQPVIIGHSFGGLLALKLAESHPDDVRKLVIVDELPFNIKMFGSDATTQSIAPKVEAMRRQMQGLTNKQYMSMMSRMATTMVTDQQGQQAVASAFTASDRTVTVQAMLEDVGTDLRPGLSATPTPTLLLYPVSAPQKPQEVEALYRTAYQGTPHITFQRVDDSRHFIMYDQPSAFDAAVEAFLK